MGEKLRKSTLPLLPQPRRCLGVKSADGTISMNESLRVPGCFPLEISSHALLALRLHVLRAPLVLPLRLCENSCREKMLMNRFSASGAHKSTLEPGEKLFHSGRSPGKLQGESSASL